MSESNEGYGGEDTHEHEWEKEGVVSRNLSVGAETTLVYTCSKDGCAAWKEDKLTYSDKVGDDKSSVDLQAATSPGIEIESVRKTEIVGNGIGDESE